MKFKSAFKFKSVAQFVFLILLLAAIWTPWGPLEAQLEVDTELNPDLTTNNDECTGNDCPDEQSESCAPGYEYVPNANPPCVLIGANILPGSPDISGNLAESTDPAVYTFLQKLPGFTTGTFDPRQECAFGQYLNIMIRLIIGISAVLSMIMFVIGGLRYMTSELVSGKTAGMAQAWNSVLGLVLALIAWLILTTLNPNLLNLCLDDLPKVNLQNTYWEAGIGADNATQTVNGQTITLDFASYPCTSTPPKGGIKPEDLRTVIFFRGDNMVTVHKAILPNLQQAMADFNDAVKTMSEKPSNQKTAEDRYTIAYAQNINATSTFRPCYQVSGKPGKFSSHSFGLALDINPGTNPWREISQGCRTDFPSAFVDAFTQNGFGWGGNWTSSYDTMHFSMLPAESQPHHKTGTTSYVIGANGEVSKVLCPKGN